MLNLAAQRGRRGTVCAKRAFGTTKFWCIDRSDSCFLFVVCQRGLSVEPVYKVHACARRCGCNTVLRLLLEYIMQRRCQPEATDRRWHVCCGGLGRDLSHSPEGMLDSATATLGPQTDGPGPSALNASTPHMSYTPTAPPLRLQSPRLQPRKPPSGLYIFIDVFQYLFLFSPGVRLSLRLVLSRPPGLQMHARPKADYTHSRGRLHDIARQNHALASKVRAHLCAAKQSQKIRGDWTSANALVRHVSLACRRRFFGFGWSQFAQPMDSVAGTVMRARLGMRPPPPRTLCAARMAGWPMCSSEIIVAGKADVLAFVCTCDFQLKEASSPNWNVNVGSVAPSPLRCCHLVLRLFASASIQSTEFLQLAVCASLEYILHPGLIHSSYLFCCKFAGGGALEGTAPHRTLPGRATAHP